MIRIVDASVAVKWFVDEADSPVALSLLDEVMAHPERFAVPELFFYEVGNMLGRLAFREGSDGGYSRQMRFLLTLGLHRMPLTESMLGDWTLAQARGLTAYDASYWALARELSGTWLTFDQKAQETILPVDENRVRLLERPADS